MALSLANVQRVVLKPARKYSGQKRPPGAQTTRMKRRDTALSDENIELAASTRTSRCCSKGRCLELHPYSIDQVRESRTLLFEMYILAERRIKLWELATALTHGDRLI
eukprot:comp23988_c0_seq1/m.42633 comp23988_c0_seq1/g.42633  ORF comp23988_c0_seq1/g.42633 comp23988_c0_seq1/m.42633 type:complete len:108 (-) comp23988_c0_seq1:1631-1954(-)